MALLKLLPKQATIFACVRPRLFRTSIPPQEDPYAILGLQPGASASEVRSAYFTAALKTHPDVMSHFADDETDFEAASMAAASTDVKDSSDDAFRRVHEAYKLLQDGPSANQQSRPGAWQSRPARQPQASRTDGRPDYSAVSDEQAEELFKAAFGGRGVDDMLREELDRLGLRPGVHANAVKQGLYARLLLRAQAASRLPASPSEVNGSRAAQTWPRRETVRQPYVAEDGTRGVRVRTTTRWPTGRKEEQFVDKPVYRR